MSPKTYLDECLRRKSLKSKRKAIVEGTEISRTNVSEDINLALTLSLVSTQRMGPNPAYTRLVATQPLGPEIFLVFQKKSNPEGELNLVC